MPKHFFYNNTNVNSSVDIPVLQESPECRDETSKKSLSFPVSATCESEEQDPTTKLKAFRVRNISRITIAHININSIRNKIDLLAEGVREISILLRYQRLRLMTLFLRVNLLLVILLHQLDLTEQIKEGVYLYILYI